jgi:hypothetical protein
MRALQHVIVGWQHQVLRQTGLRLLFEQIVHLAQTLNIGDFEVIFAVFLFGLQVHISASEIIVPPDFPEAVRPLEGDGNPVQPVGELNGNGVA